MLPTHDFLQHCLINLVNLMDNTLLLVNVCYEAAFLAI